MTRSEARDILITRIGWKADNTITGFVLSAINSQTDSGRYFQSEHSAITLRNVRDCQPIPSISEDKFNEYLEGVRDQCVLQMLNDVFERDFLNDDLFTLYPSGFDEAISLRMVVVIAELIMTSTRSNKTERFGDSFVGKLNYDVFREAPNKFAIRSANYNMTLGVATRYRAEIMNIQRRFGTQAGMFKTITKGQAIE